MKTGITHRQCHIHFMQHSLKYIAQKNPEESLLILDGELAENYRDILGALLNHPHCFLIDSKHPEALSSYFHTMIERIEKIMENKTLNLIAIGGTQTYDIASYLSMMFLKNQEWSYFPSTLLAQSDINMSYKNAISLGKGKTLLGMFYPAHHIYIDMKFIDHLTPLEIKSGLGKILKYHAIESLDRFAEAAQHYDLFFLKKELLLKHLKKSLLIHRHILKDKSGFNKVFALQYGEAFSTALQAAAIEPIPEGVRLSIGMDLSNFLAVRYGLCHPLHYERMHPTLFMNYREFALSPININTFLNALANGKRNAKGDLLFVMPFQEKDFCQHYFANDVMLKQHCEQFLLHAKKVL